MHRRAVRNLPVALLLSSSVALLGCSSDDDSGVAFQGNLDTVVKAMGADAAGFRPRMLARLRGWLGLPSLAHAQGACDADVENVLACTITRANPQADFALNCQPVPPDCRFSAEIEVTTNGDEVGFAMVHDLDGDRFPGENDDVAFVVTDPGAPATGDPETDFENHAVSGCNGDVWILTDGTTNFLTNETRGNFERTVSGCPEGGAGDPEPTATPDDGGGLLIL